MRMKAVSYMLLILILAAGCQKEQAALGSDRDEHGCITSAGYSWCEEKQKCIRQWEEPCSTALSLKEALGLLTESECMELGDLKGEPYRNEETKTWWFDLEMKEPKENCNPACVVHDDGTVEINWRCTGLLPE